MSPSSTTSIKNRILADLPNSEYQDLLPHLEPVDLPSGRILYEIDEVIEYLYFPSNSMISLVTEMSDGKIIEVGLVGNDGMSGIATLMGRKTSPERAIIQIPDGGVRAKVTAIKTRFEKGGRLQSRLMSYIYEFMRQVSQTAACNAAHTADARLARWLLMCQDRINSANVNLTQEFIAEMLGTRRATVSVAATALQSAGLIKYNRGNISIINRAGLENASCECYQHLKKVTP